MWRSAVPARAGALFILLSFAPLGCTIGASDDDAANGVRAQPAPAASDVTPAAELLGGDDVELTPEELERGRLDQSWRQFVESDRTSPSASARRQSTGPQAPSGAAAESWDDIAPDAVRAAAIATPVSGDVAGPSVLSVQILLDLAEFSPGIIDGRWGKNTEKAVFWLQKREGLPASGEVDDATLHRLRQLAGQPDELVAEHTLTAEDVKGPFVSLPEDIYERAQLDCLCYESLAEQLGERFHASPDLLRQLNPGVDLNKLQAGDRLVVPQVGRDATAGGARVARIVISDGGHYLHALGADGRILFHFPTTLGSDYAPSPEGRWEVTSIAWDPTWHYQPDLLTGVPDEKRDAVLPPGPNNAVGVVWMQLSKDHYGIHGTKAPETIGYATSHGCVRLTNWDARALGERIEPGVAVVFRDVQ